MDDALTGDRPGPATLAGIRNAVLKGHEPPAAAFASRLSYYPWLVVGSVCIGAFMGQVDASIAQLVLPRLEVAFDARLSAVSWVAVAYLLTLAGFLPIVGRLADMMGRKLLYTGGFLLFVVGSGLCGFATNLPMLIGFRILQAIGAACLSGNSVAIVVAAAGPQHRGRALGFQAAAQAVGLSVGPALGGLVLDTLDWRWVFWINVPFGLIGAVVGWFVIPRTRGLPHDARFDWTGAILLLPALISAIAVVNQMHVWGATSPPVLGLGVAAVVLFVLFVGVERRRDQPIVDLGLFSNRTFAVANAASFLAYAALFGVFLLLPFVLIRGYHDSALDAGLRLTVVPVVIGLVAPVAGGLSDRFGRRVLTVSGMAITTVALAGLYLVLDGKASSLLAVAVGLGGVGVGIGLFTSPNNNAIMSAAPERLTGQAGGILNVTRNSGTSVGIAAASAVLAWRVEALTGISGHTTGVAPDALIAAGRESVLLLIGFAVAAGLVSLLPTPEPPKRSGATSVPE